MPGFVDYMYKTILPACFLAPLKPTFELNDGNSFVVSKIATMHICNVWNTVKAKEHDKM